jgi:hypothetical protein
VQHLNPTGAARVVVDCLVDDPDADRAEVAAVKVYAYEVPEFRLGQEVRFTGLTALPYVLQGQNWVSLSFAAEGFELPGSRARPRYARCRRCTRSDRCVCSSVQQRRRNEERRAGNPSSTSRTRPTGRTAGVRAAPSYGTRVSAGLGPPMPVARLSANRAAYQFPTNRRRRVIQSPRNHSDTFTGGSIKR